MELLGVLALKDCKKSTMSKAKKNLVSLLEAVVFFLERQSGASCERGAGECIFFLSELEVSAGHCLNIIRCEDSDATKLKTALGMVKDADSDVQDSPLVKAFQAHANGIALIATATAVLEGRADDIKLEETLQFLHALHDKLPSNQDLASLLKLGQEMLALANDAK